MTAIRLHRYPSPSGGIALGKMGVGAKLMRNILPAGARWVEYLESTGTQWIDTGVPTYASARIEFGFTLFSSSTAAVFGNLATQDAGVFFGTASNSIVYCNNTMNPITPRITLSTDTEYRVVQQGGNITINGIDYSTISAVDAVGSIYLFARRRDGLADRVISGRISYFRITANNAPVRSFAPIAIGTTGYMLDLVSGEYLPYGNKGTGNFVIGPDINAPAI